MLHLEVEEACLRARALLEKMERAHPSGKGAGRRKCRQVTRELLKGFVEGPEESLDLVNLKDKLFAAKKEAAALGNQVELLQRSVARRNKALETQRIGYMREVIALKEALFSGAQDGVMAFDDSSGSHVRRPSLCVPADALAFVQRLQHGSQADGEDNATGCAAGACDGEDDSEDNNNLGGPTVSERADSAALSQHAIQLTALLKGAQDREKRALVQLEQAHQLQNEHERELAELRDAVDQLSKVDEAALREQIHALKKSLQQDHREHSAQALRWAERERELEGRIAKLERLLATTGPATREAVATAAFDLTSRMEAVQERVQRAATEYNAKLQRAQERMLELAYRVRYSPKMLHLERENSQLRQTIAILTGEAHDGVGDATAAAAFARAGVQPTKRFLRRRSTKMMASRANSRAFKGNMPGLMLVHGNSLRSNASAPPSRPGRDLAPSITQDLEKGAVANMVNESEDADEDESEEDESDTEVELANIFSDTAAIVTEHQRREKFLRGINDHLATLQDFERAMAKDERAGGASLRGISALLQGRAPVHTAREPANRTIRLEDAVRDLDAQLEERGKRLALTDAICTLDRELAKQTPWKRPYQRRPATARSPRVQFPLSDKSSPRPVFNSVQRIVRTAEASLGTRI